MSGTGERSYWAATAQPYAGERLSGDLDVEVAVIGGGLTGLAAAYHLAHDHGADVVVLEAHEPGWGASGRNAGMVVPAVGKLTVGERLAKWGPDATRRSGELGAAGVSRVRELIEQERIDCDLVEGGWLQVAHRPEKAAGAAGAAASWRDALGQDDVTALAADELARDGWLRGPAAHGAVRIPRAFGIHPLKYVHGLAAAAGRHGARLYSQAAVREWSRRDGTHALACDGGVVRARRVVVATDAHTPPGLHPRLDGRILATTGAVLVTRPLTAAEWDAAGIATHAVYTDMRRVLFYWRRLPDDRLLFGGRGPALGEWPPPERHRRWLEARLTDKLPPLAGVGAEHYWTGSIGLSLDRVPHAALVEDDPTVAYAGCYLGTGIALSTLWGRHVADLVTGRPVERDTPMTAQGLRRFPLPALRRHYFNLTRIAFELEDRHAPNGVRARLRGGR